MKKLHKILLEMLDYFIDFCKKYNITYFADSGTLLGAVRNQKIIQHDDDIDLILKREDYNKLLSLTKEFDNGKYFIQTPYTDENYFEFMIKVRDRETIYSYETEDKFNHNKGVYIDIFVLDSYIDDELNSMTLFEDSLRLFKNYSCFRYVDRLQFNNYLNISEMKMVFDLQNLLLTKLSNINYNSKYVANTQIAFVRAYRNKKLERKIYDEIEYIKFEGLKNLLAIPKEYNKVLELWYGKDYMIEKKENSGHSFLGKSKFLVLK